MSSERRRIQRVTQRWRKGSVSSCFAWPSNEVLDESFMSDLIENEVLTSGKMPNWRYRVAHGIGATTPLVATETGLEFRPGHIFLGKWCANVSRFGYYQCDGDLFFGSSTIWVRPSAPATTLHAQTDAEALIRALKDARSKQTHFRGGNFLAELTDTIRGLRNPAKGFRRLVDTYHRNARRSARRAAGRRSLPRTQQDMAELQRSSPRTAGAVQRALSDSWLEANFGWAPLLNDAADAYQAIRRLSAKVSLARFFGQSSTPVSTSYVNDQRSHDITVVRFSVRNEQVSDVRYYGAVKIETSCPTASAIEEMGVRARDFIPAVWEAIPYSFLIDYFSNIGDVIEVASFPTSDIAWAARTYRNHSYRSIERCAINGKYSPTYPANNSNEVFSFQPAFVKWRRSYVNRIGSPSLSVPRIRFEIPGSKNWRKWANIAALARLRTL